MTTPGEERPPVVLVTGASGSIGAATVACLRDRGCEVVTADRTPRCHAGHRGPHC